MALKTPLLLLLFNRPEETRRVFKEIRKARPTKLFIAADGPRGAYPEDEKRCKQARAATEKIDWQCETQRLYRNTNLGCKDAVSGALDWFFANVDEGIVLEDDILPGESFFNFCEEMLNFYRRDKDVMHISGANFSKGNVKIDSSYYFSKYIHVWGWATWRRAWKHYDVSMKSWKKFNSMVFLDKYKTDLVEKLYWKTLFKASVDNKIDTWDYQWVYSVWVNGGKSIIPSVNLVKNIGFGESATHTGAKISDMANIETAAFRNDYHHPGKEINAKADEFARNKVYKINLIKVLEQAIYYETR